MIARGLVAAILCASLPCAAADLGAAGELAGNVTGLGWRTRDSGGERIDTALARLRLDLDGGKAAGEGELVWRLAYETQAVAGGLVRSADYDLLRASPEPTALDLEDELAAGRDYVWTQRVTRAHVGWENDDWRVLGGRQRVAWGSGRFWNPTDRFNPTSPLALESGQKTGVDALLVERHFGEFGSLQAVAAAGRSSRGVSRKAALRWRDTVGESDYAVLGGAIGDEPILGFDVAANLRGGTFYVEATAGWPAAEPRYAQAAIGYDTAWQPPGWRSPLSLSAEWLRNGAATGRAPSRLPTDRIETRRRDLVAVSIGYELTPLLRVQGAVLADADTGSRLLMPRLVWAPAADTDIELLGQFAAGSPAGEFGGRSTVVAVRATRYF